MKPERFNMNVEYQWIDSPGMARRGGVENLESEEEFDVTVDLFAVKRWIAEAAALTKNGKATALGGAVRAKHIRPKGWVKS